MLRICLTARKPSPMSTIAPALTPKPYSTVIVALIGSFVETLIETLKAPGRTLDFELQCFQFRVLLNRWDARQSSAGCICKQGASAPRIL